MTESQERHLQSIKDSFRLSVDFKYRAGAAEHGGDLQAMPVAALVDNCIAEVIDLFTYLQTLETRLIEQNRSLENLRLIVSAQDILIRDMSGKCNDYTQPLSPKESAD